jgi:UDP-MurNAc hydroxylase
MHLTFINHACVKLRSRGTGVLCDPWLEGTAFNDGWSLIVPTPLDLDAVMDGVTHIWVSHEHPDHFSPRFFIQIAPKYAGSVEILFQKTLDGRVRKFLESKTFKVREIADGETATIAPGVTARLGRMPPYDSWLLLSDGERAVLNVNDCLLNDAAAVERIKPLVGSPDVLLTQYSYAAWKGGRDNRAFRDEAARQKLDIIRAQTQVLRPKAVLPFASLVYFSHVENSYLNDAVNTPRDAAGAIVEAGAAPIVLWPGEGWEVGTPHDNAPVLARYDTLYAGLGALPLIQSTASVPLPELEKKFAGYRERVYKKNSKFLIGVARLVPLVGAFRPVAIGLTDLGKTVRISVVDGMAETAGSPEISMHSSSLAFILDQEFGFDTLTVNGRFESTPAGFSRFVRSFGIGALNAMGLSVNWSLLLHGGTILSLFGVLWRVVGMLRRTRPAAQAT